MKHTLIDGKTIAIVGGGPVGLLTARLLQMNGGNVHVFERDPDPPARISGGTLDIHHDTGQIALQEAGLLEAYFEKARPVTERQFDKLGNLLFEQVPTKETQRLRPEIDRKDFRKIILDVLLPGTVSWDKQVMRAEKIDGSYLLAFQDGLTATADILIGADGGRSKIRPLVTNTPRVYTGSTIIQGDIPHPSMDCPAIMSLTQGANMAATEDGKVVFLQYRADGSLNYYLSFRRPEDWFNASGVALSDRTAMADFLSREFTGWAPVYHQLFRATTEFQLLLMYQLPIGSPWETFDHITLVGDAAHVMPPFAGVGVNIGLLDALNLANNLTKGHFNSVPAAIEDYTRKMFAYASKAQADTQQAELDFHEEEHNGHFGEKK